MPLSDFRIPSAQTNLQFVEIIADEGRMRAVARIERAIIEDAFPNEDYHKNRLQIIERNLGALAPIIQATYEAGQHTDYTDSLGITSGNDKLIVIGRNDLLGVRLR